MWWCGLGDGVQCQRSICVCGKCVMCRKMNVWHNHQRVLVWMSHGFTIVDSGFKIITTVHCGCVDQQKWLRRLEASNRMFMQCHWNMQQTLICVRKVMHIRTPRPNSVDESLATNSWRNPKVSQWNTQTETVWSKCRHDSQRTCRNCKMKLW